MPIIPVAGLLAVWLAGRTLRRALAALERVEVRGPSMEPLLMDGDRLLVDHAAYRHRPPSPGDVVVAERPDVSALPIVKRVVRVVAEGTSSQKPEVRVELRGDNPEASTDSRAFGLVTVRQVHGKVWYRYWPPQRRGRIPPTSR